MPGFGERAIFRELFPTGLTLLDRIDPAAAMNMTMSHLAARLEVRDLVVTLDLAGLEKVAATL